MPNVPFQVGDGIQIGAAVITASGAAILLPANTSVGGTQVATSTDVSTGGGPKITNLQITDNSWAVLDDTAVDTAGGYVLITGTNFVSGALVYFNQTPANSVAFVSATTLRVTVPALTAGTYIVYVINPDGGTAIRVPGLTASANPAWQTASALPEQYDGVAITLNLVATDATSYTLISGALPPGLSLNSGSGAITGTVSGVTVDTTYTFTVRATDPQNQDSPRTFTVTITVSDPYFKLTTLLLSGSAISANTVIRDSSTNNFNLTVAGDARASNFTPYGTGWSVYFDGTGDYLTIPNSVGLAFGTGDFTVEFWAYVPTSEQSNLLPILDNDYNSAGGIAFCIRKSDNLLSLGPQASGQGLNYCGFTANFALETWNHFVVVAHNSVYKAFLNGTQLSTQFGSTVVQNVSRSSGNIEIGRLMGQTSFDFGGYLSNFRVIKGTAVYTANFTPATTNLTSVANTSLLTCHANRFLDGSTNNFAITRNGDARIVSFNPFNITNTGVNGSMYFDGTGDYLTVPNSTPVQLGTGDFEIDAWVYVSSLAATVLIDARSSATASAYTIGYNSSGFPYIYDGSTAPTGSSGITAGQWNYIVWTRASGTLRMFVNGTSVYSASNSISLTGAGTNLTICSIVSNGGQILTGYLGDLRIVKGAGITTSTVPTSPLTAIANTQLVTFQFDQPHNNHTFLDSSSNQFLITRNGNASQGTFSPFSQSGWSNYFNGSSSLQTASSSSLTFGTGDFSISFWIYPTVSTAGSNTGVMGIGPASNGTFLIYTKFPGYSDNTIFIAVYGGNSVSSSIPLNVNQWNHVAMSRASGTLSVYINGTRGVNSSLTDNLNGSVASIGKPYYTLSNEPYTGYLADIRFVKGTALYSGTSITVPTSPSTFVAGTALLTSQYNRFYDGSGITSSFTIAGSPSVQAFSPFAPTAVYNPAVHGGSMYLDGTGDALQIASNPFFNVSSSDITIELWYYPLSIPTEGEILELGSGSTTGDLQLIIRSTGFTFGGSGQSKSDVAVTINQWYHLAAVKSGTTYYLYVNGTRNTTQSGAGSASSSTVVNIGSRNNSANYISGYLHNLRISNFARYTASTITVPTSPISADLNTVVLLNFTDAAILDSTGRTVIETVGDAKSSSVQVKYGTGSLWPSIWSTSNYVRSNGMPQLFNFGGGSWTVEFWIRFTALPALGAPDTWYNLVSQGQGGGINGSSWWCGLYASSSTRYLEIWTSTSGTGWLNSTYSLRSSAFSVAVDTWYHLAYVRDNNTLRIFINGTELGSAAYSSTLFASSRALEIGSDPANTTNWSGYINDLRITRGYARYTANFTAPTVPARLK